jgi:hypothetical protein
MLRRVSPGHVVALLLLLTAGSVAAQVPPVPGVHPAQHTPITGEERLRWLTASTIGPQSLGIGVLSAGWSTAFNNPPEFGTGWAGFGKRYGIRLSGIALGNGIEAGAGAALGEDPRYLRAQEGTSFGGRVRQIVALTFFAPGREGRLQPAYARYGGIVGNNIISNAWRPESQTSVDDTAIRIVLGFGGRMAGNAFAEFWPDVRRRLRRGGN